MKKISVILAVALTLAACHKNAISEPSLSEVDLYATIGDETSTKTVMDENNNIRWSEGDQIVAFMKSSLSMKYQLAEESTGKTSARFVRQTNGGTDDFYGASDLNHNIAYYPYSETIEVAKSGSDYALYVTIPSEQTYAAESFGNGSMAMVAVSEDNDITFRNVLGVMKLQLKGTQTVTSITLKGKSNEKLSGAATVTAYTDETKPAITMSSSASTSVTLDCASGVQLSESTATVFIIALPPVLFGSGFTVTVTDTDSQTYTVETDKSNEVRRSSLLVMPPVTLGAPEEEDPEITTRDYVDEYGKNLGPGVKIGETVWAPVNCGYHETDFKYGKLYQWGRKYGQGYSGPLCDVNGIKIGTYSDTSVPTIVSGPVTSSIGQSKSNEGYFYQATTSSKDWLSPQNVKLWNSGTEDNPVKTEYDPCPDGWRVPTYAELDELFKNRSDWKLEDDQPGYWFSGASLYTDEVSQVFFSAAGGRYYDGSIGTNRGFSGNYWSSGTYSNGAYYLSFYDFNPTVEMYYASRAFGISVRCVQVTDEVAEL